MDRTGSGTFLGAASSEFFIAGSALLMLLAAQWILSTAIHGANYYGFDGKMAQATVLGALKYGRLFEVTSISPIEGIGSQILPMNVWANPAYWPFAFFDRETATDVSALIALGCFASSVYIMMRCFDVPVVPSVIAGQLCIGLFAPILLILLTPTVFCLTPGNAVVYAPHLISLGLLARLEPGSWRRIAITTIGIFALLFYSLCLDPLWTMVNGFSYAVAFGVVTVGSLRIKNTALRVGALACCGALLLASGAADYLHTLSQYTVRVQYPALVDRPRAFELVSALTYSVNANAPQFMKYFYLTFMLGCLLGLLALRGRGRLLPLAALMSFFVYVAYSTVYLLLLKAVWVPPIPIYFEQSLCALYISGAAAGYWGALQAGIYTVRRRLAASRRAAAGTPPNVVSLPPLSPGFGVARVPRSWPLRVLTIGIALVGCAIVPATVSNYAINESALAEIYYQPWSDEPELMNFFRQNIGSSNAGQPLRGSITVSGLNEEIRPTIVAVWAEGMHTTNEYGQLVTPQAVYFLYAFFKQHEVLGSLNQFVPLLRTSWHNFAKANQLFGVRYYASNGHVDAADQSGHRLFSLPRRRPGKEPASWYVYELPRPNVGNYSPTEVVTMQSATETIAKISEVDFDFTKRAVLFSPINEPLVEARDMQVSRMRGGFHASGHSDGTSLVILPLQYSHCLRARDTRVRIVRANLMMAGMIFSGDIDTDIVFNYGIFSSACRHDDLADLRQLDLKIDLRMPHLTGDRIFPDWGAGVARLREAGIAMGLFGSPKSTEIADQPLPEEPAPVGPVATQQTLLDELPKPTTDGFALIGIQGLNAQVQEDDPVLLGQTILRLVAVPTESRHYLAAEATKLERDRIYRVMAWVKAAAGATAEMELRDGLDPRDGKPANYAKAGFDLTKLRVVNSSAGLKGSGIEEGPDGWQKIWIDMPTTNGEIVLALGLINRNRSVFKGDGRMDLTFGGIEFIVGSTTRRSAR